MIIPGSFSANEAKDQNRRLSLPKTEGLLHVVLALDKC